METSYIADELVSDVIFLPSVWIANGSIILKNVREKISAWTRILALETRVRILVQGRIFYFKIRNHNPQTGNLKNKFSFHSIANEEMMREESSFSVWKCMYK